MTSSRSRTACLLAASLMASVAITVYGAAAQEKPRSLVPPLGQTPPQQTDSTSPASPTQTPPEQTKVIEGSRIKGAVVVQSLGGLDPASIGTLTASTGGFGPNMWQGTKPERVVTLLKFLPVPSASPEMQRLFRRLLLTAAVIPQGLKQPLELIKLRLDKLLEAGLVPDAAELIARIPASSMSPDINRVAVKLHMLRGKNEEACRLADGSQAVAEDNFWTKTDVFCNLISGNMARAEIGINLLDETAGEDPLFFALFDRLAGGSSALPENDQALTPLHFAMMSRAGAHLPYPDIEKAGYAFLWALATDEKANINERFTAAYESLGVGSIPPVLPRRLISAGAFTDGAEEVADLGRIASLYRDAIAATDDLEKARILGELWTAGESDGSYLAASSLTMPLLLQMTPADYGGAFELDALRLSLVAGEEQSAIAWERGVRRGALKGDFAAREAARKRIARASAYMLISGTSGIARWNAATFDVADLDHGEDVAQTENVGLYLNVMEIFGEPVPEDLWSSTLDLGQVPRLSLSNQVIQRNLASAAAAGRVGETVALALSALGEEGPGMVSTETLGAVLTALKTVGLEAEARQLALEAAVSRNL